MKSVGLTGGIGSGKSTVAKIFSVLGVPVFESDKEAKYILDNDSAVLDQIKAQFGESVIDANGKIDKKSLAAVVFCNKNRLNALNEIVHPAVRTRFERWRAERFKAGHHYVINEAAILFESGLDELMDYNITVSAPIDIRIERVQRRDCINVDEVVSRVRNQMADEEREKRADAVLINDGIKAVMPQVLYLHSFLQKDRR